ncbi:hypothetical protein TVNIR_2361 [Thioalkalivibrio nitratireducens DSM 14787]|uniref:Uncharacterized protein n=1 Tax=Thioalkalivibrio nitratireducens (strain DSM 14787 / UNIQEM 213 / ALEN2) TaxID=1255043 RepID=L0DWM7_THIND|nr:hypothetical protein [Thioalkalivibrio nitratireducens]AGA34004.1 hypothetical protein TVNIR_2361 [Thioalkalivibrio nitratireducens DSM 14787]
MRLLIVGVAVALAGLALLLAQATRALEPGLALSLLAYAVAFGGMLAGIAGAIRGFQRRR